MEESRQIVHKVTFGTDSHIHYKHFKQLIRPDNNPTNSSPLMSPSSSSNSSSYLEQFGNRQNNEPAVIVVAHLSLDQEMILQDEFEKKLCTSVKGRTVVIVAVSVVV
jgi:hypothetical protein